MFSYYFMKVLSWFVCRLPYSLCTPLGNFLGALCWPLVPHKRKLLSKHQIMTCLGVSEAAAERISRAAAVRFGTMFLEVLRFPLMVGNIQKYVTLQGAVDEVRSHLATGKGCIFATSHSGNWELMGAAFAQYGFPLIGIAKKQKSSGMDRFINEYREMTGMQIVYTNNIREMYGLLKHGKIIGLITDQDPSRRDGIILDFFSQETNCVTGAATLARFEDVPIFLVTIHRQKNGHHIVTVEHAITVKRTKNKRDDIRRTTQELTHHLEEYIRQVPEDWFWLHDRWKSMREE